MNLEAQKYLEKGFELHAEQDFEQAEIFYLKAIKANPENSIAHVQLAQLNVIKGQFEEARKLYDRALELDGGNSEIHVGIGHFYLAQSQTDRALEHFEKALMLDKNSLGAHCGIAEALAQKNLPLEVLKKCEEILHISPHSSEHVFLILGRLYRQIGILSEAIRRYERVLEVNPFHFEARFQLALCLEFSKQTNLALSHCRLLLKFVSDKQRLQQIKETIARLETVPDTEKSF